MRKKNPLTEGDLQNPACLKINMTTEQFAYWLQGFSEVTGNCPTEEQWMIIKDHLNLVFNKVTPNYNTRIIPNYTSPTSPITPITPSYTTPPNWISCGIVYQNSIKNINTNPLATNIKIC